MTAPRQPSGRTDGQHVAKDRMRTVDAGIDAQEGMPCNAGADTGGECTDVAEQYNAPPQATPKKS